MSANPAVISSIRRLLSTARLRPGERLGSERAIAESLGVPRSAVSSALAQLEGEGLVTRAMGAAGGVFASDGRIERRLNTIDGVPAMLRQQGYDVFTRVLRVELGQADPAESRNLELSPGEAVLRVQRLRLANAVPWSLDTSVLPAQLFPALATHDLTQSLYALLRDNYGVEPAEADETVDLSSATDGQAALLEIELGAPLLQVWRVARTHTGQPLEYAHDYFRADRTRLHLRRLGARWKRPVN